MNDLRSLFQLWRKTIAAIPHRASPLRPVCPLGKTALGLICITATIFCATAKNVAPVAQSMAIAVGANFANPLVLQGSDANGDPITFSIVSPPTRGTLSGAAPNLTYTPFVDYLGLDSFRFIANDGRVSSTPATVSLTVKPGILVKNTGITEGDGEAKTVTFLVSSTAALSSGSCSYSTVDGTAIAAEPDYLPTGGKLDFAFSRPVLTTFGINVAIIGDTVVEPNETFLLQLFNPSPDIVLLNGGIGRCTIINDDFRIFSVVLGTAALTPENSTVTVGEPVTLSLDWTHPVGWRQLDSVDLLLSDNEGTVLRARWHEAANAFSLLNAAADNFLRIAEAGSPERLETPVAALHLTDSTGGGPPGQTATIDFSLSFKPEAAGRTFSVEAFAVDDAGNQQGYESVGTITVSPR